MKSNKYVSRLLVIAVGGVAVFACNIDLNDLLTPDFPYDNTNDNMQQPEPVDPTTTVCDSFDFGPYESRCGSLMLDKTEVNAGDILTVTVDLTCGGGQIACDYAEPGLTEVDGNQVAESSSGYPQLYHYEPPTPEARGGGSVVDLGGGAHTIRFFLKFSAPNDCLTVTGDMAFADGPFVFLGSGGGYWSSVQSFRIHQTGI